jgi:hypothetical protein
MRGVRCLAGRLLWLADAAAQRAQPERRGTGRQGTHAGADWRLGLLFSLKTAVAKPECSKQSETRLAGFPTILGACRFNLRAPLRVCRNPRMSENGILRFAVNEFH